MHIAVCAPALHYCVDLPIRDILFCLHVGCMVPLKMPRTRYYLYHDIPHFSKASALELSVHYYCRPLRSRRRSSPYACSILSLHRPAIITYSDNLIISPSASGPTQHDVQSIPSQLSLSLSLSLSIAALIMDAYLPTIRKQSVTSVRPSVGRSVLFHF